MSAFDDEIAQTAKDTIAEFGASVTLIRVSEGSYDPATGTTTNTETSEALKAVVEDYTPWELQNGLGVVGGKKFTCAALGLTIPLLTDKITLGTDTFLIAKNETTYSGSIPILYVLGTTKT